MTDCAGRHQCEPDRYPIDYGDTWVCPDCGKRYVSFRVADNFDRYPWVMRRHIGPNVFGWTTEGTA